MNIDYKTEIDLYKEQEWDAILENFDDSSIYQTWSYGKTVSNGNIPITIVLKYDGKIVAACLLRIVKTEFLNAIGKESWLRKVDTMGKMTPKTKKKDGEINLKDWTYRLANLKTEVFPREDRPIIPEGIGRELIRPDRGK